MKKHFKENFLNLTATLKDALSVLDNSPIGIVFITDEQQRVQGIMTDGDVRRAVLNGNDLMTPVQQLMVKDFIYGKSGDSREIHARMLNDVIRHLPILDENGRMVDFISFLEFCWLPVMEPSLIGNELNYVIDCINTNWISSQGSYVKKFQEHFAGYHDIDFALTTSNGTTALHLALLAIGVGSGDEVIVPDLTFAASANTVIHCGAKPVLIDVEPQYWNMNPHLIEKAITPRTKAIMPVHLYGHPCDMEPIMELAKKHRLYIVEDCAESLGARYKGKLTGTFGEIGCFSFFSNKVITTGEGGMVITRNKDLYEKMEILRDHGMRKSRRYWHEVVGYNYRMTNLQAAIGLAQIEQIDRFIENRRKMAAAYSNALQNLPGITLPPEMLWAKNIYWLYSILVDESTVGISRDKLMAELQKEGIETRPLFYPLHIQPPYRDLNCFPVAERLSSQGLSLPSANSISVKEIKRVCECITQIILNHNRIPIQND